MFSRYGIEYSAPLGETVKRLAGGSTYRSHVVTVEAPLATSVAVTQARTDAASAVQTPLSVVQTGPQTWQARTLDEIEGTAVGAARVRMAVTYPDGQIKNVPALDGPSRKVGSSATVVVAAPEGMVATTVLDETTVATEETLIPDVALVGDPKIILEMQKGQKPVLESGVQSPPQVPEPAWKKYLVPVGGAVAATVGVVAGLNWWKNRGQQNRW